MNQLKNILATLGVVLAIFTTVTYMSCKKTTYTYNDECANVSCQNGASCYKGSCTCVLGYEGEFCEKKSIAPYLGKWDVSQLNIGSSDSTAIGDTARYEISISEGEGPTVLIIDGLLGSTSNNGIKGRLSLDYGLIEEDTGFVEVETLSTSDKFIINKYQVFKSSGRQVMKATGSINSFGTYLFATLYLTGPDSTLGSVRDTLRLTAAYIQ